MLERVLMILVVVLALLVLAVGTMWYLTKKEKTQLTHVNTLLEESVGKQQAEIGFLKNEIQEREKLAKRYLARVQQIEKDRDSEVASLRRLINESSDECADKPMPVAFLDRLRRGSNSSPN